MEALHLSSAFFVSTHSRPKAAGKKKVLGDNKTAVSTHSRPKAAGAWYILGYPNRDGFNTQPPEGGWLKKKNQI